MRRLVLRESSRIEELEEAVMTGSALELELREAPRSPSRLELLRTLARAASPVVARFAGTIGSPLAEIAGLSTAAEWAPGSHLDLRGALLTPFLWSLGHMDLKRALIGFGTLVPAGVLLRPHAGTRHSPRAVRLVLALLDDGRGGSEALALGRELAAFRFVMTLPDRQEGVRAFLDKREPRFDW